MITRGELYAEIMDWAEGGDETLLDLTNRIWELLQEPAVEPAQPYGCKCGESPRLVEGAHLASCPHYSDEGTPPGYRVGNTDERARGPFPNPH